MCKPALRFALALVFILPGTLLSAQADYSAATLKGTVFDPQQFVVTGARVQVTNPSTGWSKLVETGVDGVYRFPLLPPGRYSLDVQAPGFGRTRATVLLSVGEVVNYDVRLRLALASESVEVKEEVPLVEVERTQQANNISRTQLADLPNLTHLFTDSILTLPGVSSAEAPRAQTPGFTAFVSTGLSIGGNNGRRNLITIDGGENDFGSGQLRTPHLPVDSVQELQVNRSAFASEFGFTTGTAVNLVTRGGTNNWHGSANAWFGNDHTNGSNYFAPSSGPKAFEQNFVTGFTVGGPLHKNRLFLFAAFEFVKRDSPQFRDYANSTAAQGIRSNVAQQDYVAQLTDSGDPLLQSAAAKLQFLLDPHNFENTSKLLAPNTGVFNDWKKFHNFVTRLDYQPTSDDLITARYSFTEDDSSTMDVLDPSNAPDDAVLQYWRDYTILTSWNHIFGPQRVNQLRVQIVPYSKIDGPVSSPDTAYLRIAGLGQFGGEHYEPFAARERRFQFEDSFSALTRKHTLKFGASYRPFSYEILNALFFGGDFQFWDGTIPIIGSLIPPGSAEYAAVVSFNVAHGLPPTGRPATYLTALESFNVGMPVAYRQGFGNPQVRGSEQAVGAYAQDSWKLTRGLTLDFGGRVDVYVPSPPAPANSHFSPRVAMAWSPFANHKTVLRAGGGVFVAPNPFFAGYVVNLAGDSGKYINQVAAALSPNDRRILTLWTTLTGCNPQQPWVCTKQPPFPQLQAADVQSAGFQIGPGQPGRAISVLADPYRNNYALQASMSVERELGREMSLELAYAMYHGVHLQIPLDTNVQETGVVDDFAGPLYTRIDPTLARRGTAAPIGSSIYHGILASMRRRLARGWQFEFNYTFSKTIDDCTDFNSEFLPFRSTRIDLERSLSTFDVRHNFVLSAVYTAPFRAGSGMLSHIIADMTVSPVLFLRSGIPFTVRVPGLQNGTLGSSLWARPWNAGRNTGIGPNFYSLDMRVAKAFYFDRESGRRIDFMVQGTNLFNHTNFSAVNDSFPANPNPFPVGGQMIDLLNGPYNFHGLRGIDSSQSLGFKAAFDPRQVQFGVTIVF